MSPSGGDLSEAESAALSQAIDLARSSGISRGPNPAVGCVLLDSEGTVIATGVHRGAGTAHAEVAALAAAGSRARGATAVVSLEPCAHHGRTPPCADALIAAGVIRVVYAQADPNPLATGGADKLRAAGVEVVGNIRPEAARAVNEDWSRAMALGRPLVRWKVAASLDGRIAAADGSSRWITSPESREYVHVLRAQADAVLTGTGTALKDNPALTARAEGVPIKEQPIRAVMGTTPLPAGHPLSDATIIAHRDPHEALAELWHLDVRRVLLECGPRLAGAFLEADLVDEIIWFAAPLFLGEHGLPVISGGPHSLVDATRWAILRSGASGPDVRIDLARAQQVSG